MRRRVRVIPIAIVGIALATTAMSGANRRMFPNLTIFRAGGLPQPVALQHCCTRQVTINGRSGVSLDADTLAMIYQDLTPATATQLPVDTTDSTSYTKVAEFFGTWPLPVTGQETFSTLRQPELKQLWGTATHYSFIYPGRNGGPPIWEHPVVAPGGANATYYAIGPMGQKILASLGVRLR